jgi:hypothetical protein
VETHAYYLLVLNIGENHQQQDCYRIIAGIGIDEEIRTFNNKKKYTLVLGSYNFLKHMRSKLPIDHKITEVQRLNYISSIPTQF